MKIILTPLILLISVALYAQINPILLGETYFTDSYYHQAQIFTQQNRVYVSDSLGIVAFIHHENSMGAGPQKFRYDISTNKGQTFTNDIAGLQNNFTFQGVMPQLMGINPNNSQNPLSTKLLWTGTRLDASSTFAGIVSGVSNVVTSGNASSTENYAFNNEAFTHNGGLCQGKNNEYWMAQHKSFSNGTTPLYEDTLYLFKGIYNSGTQDVNWNIEHRIYIPYNISFDGTPKTGMPNMAFSPDGMMGWCVFIADLQGGMDSTKTIVYLRTVDGGQSWSYPQEVDLWQLGNLSSLFINNPEYSTFKPGFDGDFDISVDKYGDLHCFAHFIPINAIDYSPAYTTNLGNPVWHSMVDITTTGGLTWFALEIATAYTFYQDLGSIYNLQLHLQPQISRTEDGQFVFYAWVDSDTSQFSGIPGIGYGEIENLAPNLRIEGMNVSTQSKFGVKNITGLDVIWEGRAYFPTMAPTVIRSGNKFRLPIVLAETASNGSPFINEQGKFWYFGNEATFDDPTVATSSAKNLSVNVFPNPAQEDLTVQYLLPTNHTQFRLLDITGKILYKSNFIEFQGQKNIDISHYSSGMYFYQIIANDKILHVGKFSIQK